MQSNSLWPQVVRFPKLERDIDVDVLVVGGGIAGISSAYFLNKAGYSTAVLERDEVGSAATGASSGVLYYGSGTNLVPAIDLFGKEAAFRLWKDTARSIHEMEALAESRSMDCGFRRLGGIMVAKNWKELEELDEEQAALKECGIDSRVLDTEELRSYFTPRDFAGGLTFFDVCSQIHPAQFSASLAKRHGIDVYENSKLTGWKEAAEGVVAKTQSSTIRAKKIIFATNWQPYFRLNEHFKIESSLVIASKRMPNLRSVWPDQKILWTMEKDYDIVYPSYDSSRAILEVYKRDNMSAKIDYYYGSSGFEVDKQWGSVWAKTYDWLPIVGRVSDSVLVDIAMGDQGIVMGWTCGRHIANAIEGKDDWLLKMTSPGRFGREQGGVLNP